MKRRLPRLFGITVITALLCWPGAGPALADANQIRQAERAGYVTPLAELLAAMKEQFPGRVLKVDLTPENEEGDQPVSWIYQIKVLQSNGLVLEILFDAKTLAPLEINGEPYGAQDVEENR